MNAVAKVNPHFTTFTRQILHRRIISARLIHQFKTALENGSYELSFGRDYSGRSYWSARLTAGKGQDARLPVGMLHCVFKRYSELSRINLFIRREKNKDAGAFPLDESGEVDMERAKDMFHIVDVDVLLRYICIDGKEEVLPPNQRRSLTRSLGSLIAHLKEKCRPEEMIRRERMKKRYRDLVPGGYESWRWRGRLKSKDYYSPQKVSIEAFRETFELHLKNYGPESAWSLEEAIWPIVDDLNSPRFSKVDRNKLKAIIEFVERADREVTLKDLLFYVSRKLDLEYSPIEGFDPARFTEIFRRFEVVLDRALSGNLWEFYIYERAGGASLASLIVNENELTLWPESGETPAFQEIAACVSQGMGSELSRVMHPYSRNDNKLSHLRWVDSEALI